MSQADMQGADIAFLLPHIFIAGGAVLLMLCIAFYRNHALSFYLTLATLAAALSAFISIGDVPARVTSLVVIDTYALFYSLLVVSATIAVVLMSYRHLGSRPGIREEYYVLLLLACLGSLVLVCANHLAAFFLGLELLGVSLYTLISYRRMTGQAIEAGIKYLVLAGASSAILLLGMAILYYESGSMEFADIASVLNRSEGFTAAGMAGIALTLVGIGFKLGVVPFHMWTPDVYEGSPAPVTGFIATVSKGSMFALLLRYFAGAEIGLPLLAVFTVIAVASMLAGNLLALFQNNLKRILAYSSIAHMGYALVAFLSSGQMRVTAVTFYLVAYFITALGGFGVVIALSGTEREADNIEDYRGLFRRNPWLTLMFSLFLLSLAGLPLTAGFVGKFYAVTAGVSSGLWLLIISLAAGSAIGLFYYLRVLIIMFVPADSGETASAMQPGILEVITLAALTGGLLLLGLYPQSLIRAIAAVSIGM
jgi:NADH-quinone oxidoreductase subunit N